MLDKLLEKAETSKVSRTLLSQLLYRTIPFNAPHRFSITRISDEICEVNIPFIRRNRNHIRGIHACAMATACEFSSGLLLLKSLGAKEYRLIMKEMRMEYHFQGKMGAVAVCEFTNAMKQQSVLSPLATNDKIEVDLVSRVIDRENNHLCTGTITWQLKPWEKVRTW